MINSNADVTSDAGRNDCRSSEKESSWFAESHKRIRLEAAVCVLVFDICQAFCLDPAKRRPYIFSEEQGLQRLLATAQPGGGASRTAHHKTASVEKGGVKFLSSSPNVQHTGQPRRSLPKQHHLYL